jgi:hypothetical protein
VLLLQPPLLPALPLLAAQPPLLPLRLPQAVLRLLLAW